MIRILIVEDNGPLRELDRILLRESGLFEVVGEAENGLEAVQMARRLQPEVVLLDLAMPVMDGFEAIPQIRHVAPSTRIIVLTMLSPEMSQARAMSLGAHGFLDKSIDEAEFASALRDLALGKTEPKPPARRD